MACLGKSGMLGRMDILEPGEAAKADICAVHDPAYVKHVHEFPGGMLDADTEMTPGSLKASLKAAGAAVGSVDEVLRGRPLSYGLVRPPGHHAMPGRAMGFCIFNNVAIGAVHALSRCNRVLIVDWDVHHCNGTEHMFYSNPGVLVFSVHQQPHYPGTGAAEDTGDGNGEGYNVNVPLPAGSTDADYREAFERVLVPIADQYRPEIVMVSAGFDPYHGDPLGNMQLTDEGFAMLASIVKSLAKGRGVVALLEGGYSPVLPRCVEASIAGFLSEEQPGEASGVPVARENIDRAVSIQKKYWRL